MIRISLPNGVQVAIDLAELMAAATPVEMPASQVVDAETVALVVSEDPPAVVIDDRPWLTGEALESYRATLKPSMKIDDRTHSWHGRPLNRRGPDVSFEERAERCGHCRTAPYYCLAIPGQCDYQDNGRPDWAVIEQRAAAKVNS